LEQRVALIGPDTSGVFVIAPTPFEENGQICWASTDRLVDFFRTTGVHGITILGMMGEAAKLDAQESLDFARHVIQRAGSLPVIVGASAPGFAAMRTLARAVVDVGAAAVMIAPPATCRTDDQIVTYFRQASEAMGTDIPFVIQDYPLASGVLMSTNVIERIITDNPACVMLKAEDWPGLEKISTLRRREQTGGLRRVPILCGNGGLFLDFELLRGADGAMTGYAFAELLVRMCALKAAGNRTAMLDLFDAHLPLIRYEQQPGAGLGVRKYILKRRGLLTSDAQRTPRSVLSAEARSEIDMLLERVLSRDKSIHLHAV
jgi:4-hydroxy-tetrahydrodipicolinate synthase